MGEETVSHIIGVRTVGVPVTDQDRAVEVDVDELLRWEGARPCSPYATRMATGS